MKKLLALMLAVLMLALCLAGCASKATTEQPAETETPAVEETPTPAEETTGTEETPEEATGEKPTIKFYGKCIEYTSGPMMTDALEEKLADKYNIESIQIDWSNLDSVVRTGIASNDPCDIYNYNRPRNIADMAVDLTPYLDADPELKSWFSDEQLSLGTIDGKLVSLMWEMNFPVIIGNKTAMEAAGVSIPDAWSMDEFKDACQKILDNGVYPLGNATDLNRAYWFFINAMLSITHSNNTYDAWLSGELSYESNDSKAAMEAVKSLYDQNYMYPGEGAVTVKSDEIRAAFYQGKCLMMTETAAQAATTAAEADFEVVILPWPAAGEQNYISGGGNYFFIPKNCSDEAAAVEVLKTFLSPEIQQIHAEQGYIPANTMVESNNEFVKASLRQANLFSTTPVFNAAVYDYLANGLIADLVLNGGVDYAAANLQTAATTE